ncbi:MAG TPA: hypothetical protein VMY41_16335 [Thermohalobaculum sp.]|nr:hypothetical protein [Thermohalobaculum sp.]
MKTLLFAAALLGVSPTTASDERALSGSEIIQLLAGAEVIGAGNRQKFYESGRTLYNDGRESWGYWRVEGDRYCSQWPPQEGWACYDMRRWEEGDRVWVGWIGNGGTRYDGYIGR